MDRSIHIFDAAQGREQLTLIGHTDEVMTVSWSPDGTRIASGGKDHTVRLWEARTGTQLLVLRGHATDVRSVAWSPDGLALASGSSDGQSGSGTPSRDTRGPDHAPFWQTSTGSSKRIQTA